ncbi:MAG: DUF2510 domain-containing protein [Acidimicrobiales bacterium]
MITGVSTSVLAAFGVLALLALVPIVWAIVDVVRRPSWQFSTSRKVLWVVMLGLGWLVLWPVALISSVMYLAVYRRRLPVALAPPSMATWDPYATESGGRPSQLPPAGWYSDPGGGPLRRWWDGRGWSEYLEPGSGDPSQES